MEEPMMFGDARQPAARRARARRRSPRCGRRGWCGRPAPRRVSSTDRHSFSPSVCSGDLDVVLLGDRSAVSSARAWAPMSSWTLKPLAPPSASASTSGAGSRGRAARQEADVDRPGVEGAERVRAAPRAELTPTPQTGPNSWPMIVVTPEASEASTMRGDSRWTCVSTAPAVAIRPSPEYDRRCRCRRRRRPPSRVSGLPARPIAAIRPSRMPIDGLADAQDGSIDHDVA